MYQDYYKKFFEIFNECKYKLDTSTLFYDLMKISAISIQNVFINSPELEKEYLYTINKYSKEEIKILEELFALIVMMLQTHGEIKDILGDIYCNLNYRDKKLGQVFTPEHIARVMAKSIIGEDSKSKEIISICDPTCGSGAMLMAAAHVLREDGFNFQQNALMQGTDISEICVYMTYIQASLYGIPAIIYCGNSLTNEIRFKLTTPLYHLNYFRFKDYFNNKKENTDNAKSENITYEFKETVKNGNLQVSFW